MNIIVVGQRHGESRTYRLTTPARTLLFGCLVALPFAMGAAGFWLADWLADEDFSLEPMAAEAWENDLSLQRQELEQIRIQTDQELQALTVKLAELQSRLMRLDALGERLVDVANLEAEEFDFSMAPALGGPGSIGEAYEAPEISDVLNDLADRIGHREQQLEVLDDLMSARRLDEDTFVTGRPIKKGWMSSRYGRRADPFTGQLAWHAGVDFAGKLGSDIVAVASGVVTWAGDRYGYGRLVEINHGNGYKTRYAHCLELNVKVGDIVRKGDVIAAMGSSGRSTGPHVHFEVFKNGRTVDPSAYIHRTLR
ncbi:M23 family metallopeptidase [Oceanobacter antarcticus]|jgi:murein DD-endopeptidase MepM/ murein hydrolase activator NlpD|uniref:M23 family metallopeptidase n=1 Tax=Oceanobacter antarcticus TaxID=3133425 RepID=A0ABW8NK44_9GAMM